MIDFAELGNNDWLAVNQFTVIEDNRNRRADVVVFVNGLPLALIELKNPGDENATVQGRVQSAPDIQEGHSQPSSPTTSCWWSPTAWMHAPERSRPTGSGSSPWRTIDGEEVAPAGSLQLDVLIKGIFDKRAIPRPRPQLRRVRGRRRQAAQEDRGYHQFHAVNKAVELHGQSLVR